MSCESPLIEENKILLSCQLCGCIGSFKHILSSCQTALADGHYRWRYDLILKEIVAVVSMAISTNIPNYNKSMIIFVRAGVKSKPKEKLTPNALSLATDWEIRADLETRLKFPDHIAQTSFCPDILIFSNKIKKIIIWELTVSWEEHVEEGHEGKKFKYDENNGRNASCTPTDVGSRGFIAGSLSKALSSIGLLGTRKRKAIETIIKTAERTAKWV